MVWFGFLSHPDRVETVQLQPVHGLWRQQRTELRAAERTCDTHRPQNVSETTHTQNITSRILTGSLSGAREPIKELRNRRLNPVQGVEEVLAPCFQGCSGLLDNVADKKLCSCCFYNHLYSNLNFFSYKWFALESLVFLSLYSRTIDPWGDLINIRMLQGSFSLFMKEQCRVVCFLLMKKSDLKREREWWREQKINNHHVNIRLKTLGKRLADCYVYAAASEPERETLLFISVLEIWSHCSSFIFMNSEVGWETDFRSAH